MKTIYDFEAVQMNGQSVSLDPMRGQVMLIVNTASACGFTPQFGGLEKLHQAYEAQGLRIMGFPCNQFGSQDPGSNADIANFCQRNYGVTFPMMEKIEVNGSNAHPLYQWLCAEAPGLLGSKAVKWNFTKFLLDEKGNLLAVFPSKVKPMGEEITAYLK